MKTQHNLNEDKCPKCKKGNQKIQGLDGMTIHYVCPYCNVAWSLQVREILFQDEFKTKKIESD